MGKNGAGKSSLLKILAGYQIKNQGPFGCFHVWEGRC